MGTEYAGEPAWRIEQRKAEDEGFRTLHRLEAICYLPKPRVLEEDDVAFLMGVIARQQEEIDDLKQDHT